MKKSGILASIALGLVIVLAVFGILLATGAIGGGEKEKLIFKSGSAEKFYDGTPLKCDEWNLINGNLKEGHKVEASVIGSEIYAKANPTDNLMTVKIVNEKGKDVTKQYDIEYQYGELKVKPAQIKILVGSSEKPYDGTKLEYDSFEIVSGMKAEKDTFVVKVTGERTEVGESPNTALATAVNEHGQDVSSNYEFIYVNGAIIISPRSITIQSMGATKTYDGTALTNEEVNIIAGELFSGHTMNINVTGSQTDAGTSKNTFAVEIVDENGKDVLYNYKIEYLYGDLVVAPRPITIRTASDMKVYDGTPLRNEEWRVVSTHGMLPEHHLRVIVTGEQTEIGKSNNQIGEIIVTDEVGNIINYNYSFATLQYGYLVVTDADGYYGSGGTSGGDTTGGGVGDGGMFDVIIGGGNGGEPGGSGEGSGEGSGGSGEGSGEGSGGSGEGSGEGSGGSGEGSGEGSGGSGEGSGEGSGDSGEGSGEGSGGSGEGSGEGSGGSGEGSGEGSGGSGEGSGEGSGGSGEGSGEGSGGSGEGSGEGSGGSGEGSGEGNDGNDNVADGESGLDQSGNIGAPPMSDPTMMDKTVVMRIRAQFSGTVYMRSMNYGNYLGQRWNPVAPEYDVLLDGKYCANYLTGLAIENAGMISQGFDIEPFSSDYTLPTYLDNDMHLYTIQTSDVKYEGTTKQIYSAYAFGYNYGDIELTSVPEEYLEYEAAYREFVYANYLNVPKATNDYLQLRISSLGFSKDDPDIINKVADFIQNSATYNLNYDRTLDEQNDVVVAFLSNPNAEGICQHYAGAATLMFRALGIPARYTIGYAASAIEGDWSEVTAGDAHAWVEVYLDSIGWVAVEVTGAPSDDEITGDEEDENGQPGEDGEPGEDGDDGENGENGGNSGNGENGGNGGNSGNGENGGNGEEENYKYPIKVTPHNVYHKYDGTVFYAPADGGIYIDENDIKYFNMYGYTYEYTLTGSCSEIGYGKVTFESFNIYNKDHELINDQFEIELKAGTIHVYETELYMSSNNYTSVYNGMLPTLSYEYYMLDGETQVVGLLEETHQLKVTFRTPSANVQSSSNSFTAKVMDGSEDVSKRYYIIYDFGRINITRRQLTVTIDSAQKEYDGTELTCDTWSITSGELCENHEAIVAIKGSQTSIGISDNVGEKMIIIDKETGKDVTSNYIYEFIFGTLMVTPPQY